MGNLAMPRLRNRLLAQSLNHFATTGDHLVPRSTSASAVPGQFSATRHFHFHLDLCTCP